MATSTERFGFTKPAGSDPASVVPLNSNTDLIEQYLGATQDMIAPLYDATAGTYSEGDIVTYESKLYKALEDIDTPEDFDETKWEETTAVSEGGGASNVEANPAGTPTDTLNTIGINGTIYGIEGGGSISGEGVEIYSEDEYIVGKWIDGKKLYQKSIKFSATSLSTNWMTIEQGVDYNLAFPEVQGLYYTSNGEPFTQSTRVFVQNGDLKIQPLNELDLLSSTLKHVITIRYTKTVETPAPAWGGSVNNYYANFIDTDNVIQAETQVSSGTTGTYTASEDCYIRAKLWRSSTGASSLSIDGVEVLTNYSDSGTSALYNTIPLKKGQIATIDAGAGSPCSYTVYGISYGSGGSSSGSSVDYSTEEKEVGTWIDGSKVYEKTVALGSMPAQGSTKSVNHSIDNLGLVIEASIIVKNTSNIQYPVPMVSRLSTGDQTTYYISQTAVTVVNGSNSSIDETASGYAVLTYTKAVS